MKNLSLLFRALILTVTVSSLGLLQGQEALLIDGMCAFTTDRSSEQLYSFPADQQSSALFARLQSMSGKSTEVTVMAANVQEVVAAEKGNRRFILYNPFILNGYLKSGKNNWRTTALIAHALGHHVNLHSFEVEPRLRLEIETEADRFAGYLMFRLGATTENIKTALTNLTGSPDSPNYPDSKTRVASFLEGWHDGKAEAGSASSFDESSDNIPQFPIWPPPRASGNVDIPGGLLTRGLSQPRLMDAAARLLKAFEIAGYGERSFYAVPDGFALVARMERIYPDGRPIEGDGRWPVNVSPPRVFSLLSYLRALFDSNPGFYRVIAFVVTSHPLVQSRDGIKGDPPRDWVWAGANRLPTIIGFQNYTPSVSCTALVYEFQQTNRGAEAILDTPGLVTGRAHLERSSLLSALGN